MRFAPHQSAARRAGMDDVAYEGLGEQLAARRAMLARRVTADGDTI
jgi:hypothetical protein